jgi:hypothetical protein
MMFDSVGRRGGRTFFGSRVSSPCSCIRTHLANHIRASSVKNGCTNRSYEGRRLPTRLPVVLESPEDFHHAANSRHGCRARPFPPGLSFQQLALSLVG